MYIIINLVHITGIILLSSICGQHPLDPPVDGLVFAESHVSAPVIINAVSYDFLLHFWTEDEVVVWAHEHGFDALKTKSFSFWVSFFWVFYFQVWVFNEVQFHFSDESGVG